MLRDVEIWDIRSKRLVHKICGFSGQLDLDGHGHPCDFSETGDLMACPASKSVGVDVWDCKSWTRAGTIPCQNSCELKFDPSARWLAIQQQRTGKGGGYDGSRDREQYWTKIWDVRQPRKV